MSVLIGIDPGARDTGIIAIFDGTRVVSESVHNEGPLLPLTWSYISQVGRCVDALIDEAEGDAVIKIEGVTAPNWHVAKDAKRGAATNPTGLLGTAQMLGALMGWYGEDAVIVPPRGNGSKPLGAYPLELVSKGERRTKGWELRVGTGKMRHVRSAWDIAHYEVPEPVKHRRTCRIMDLSDDTIAQALRNA